jgi:hypothetical protein
MLDDGVTDRSGQAQVIDVAEVLLRSVRNEQERR